MVRSIKLFLLLLAILVLPRPAFSEQWTVIEETLVEGAVTGSVTNGYIFKTMTGNYYELTDYVYLYKYLYSPRVLVLNSGNRYRLIIDGFDQPLNAKKIGTTDAPATGSSRGSASSGGVVESYITSKFNGLDYGNLYRLANGQIWEQTEAWVWAWVWVNPKVIIYPSSGGHKMKVENIDHAVIVRRVR